MSFLGKLWRAFRTTFSRGEQHDPAPVVDNLVNALLADSVKRGASHIYIERGPDTTSIRFRISGELCDIMVLPLEIHGPLVGRIALLAGLPRSDHRSAHGGHFRFRLKVENRSQAFDFHVSCPPMPGPLVLTRTGSSGTAAGRD